MGAGLGGLVAPDRHAVLDRQLRRGRPVPAHQRHRRAPWPRRASSRSSACRCAWVSRIVGVLFAANRSARPFAREDVSLLTSLAAHAAVAIDNARLLEETRAALAELSVANKTSREHSDAVERAAEAHDRMAELVLRGGDVVGPGRQRGRACSAAALASSTRTAGRSPGWAMIGTETRSPRPPRRPAVWAAPSSAGDLLGDRGRPRQRLAVHPGAAPSAAAERGRTCASSNGPRWSPRCCCCRGAAWPRRRAGSAASCSTTWSRARSTTADTVRERARRLGVDLDRPHAVLVLKGRTGARQRVAAWAASQAAAARAGWPPTATGWACSCCPATTRARWPAGSAKDLRASVGSAGHGRRRRAGAPARPRSPTPTGPRSACADALVALGPPAGQRQPGRPGLRRAAHRRRRRQGVDGFVDDRDRAGARLRPAPRHRAGARRWRPTSAPAPARPARPTAARARQHGDPAPGAPVHAARRGLAAARTGPGDPTRAPPAPPPRDIDERRKHTAAGSTVGPHYIGSAPATPNLTADHVEPVKRLHTAGLR